MNFYKMKKYYEIDKSYKVSVHPYPLIFLGVSYAIMIYVKSVWNIIIFKKVIAFYIN